MKNPIKFLIPPRRWRVPVIIVLGILVGLFFYLLYISNAFSYISDDPRACVNCHIMAPQYATWSHSAHREVTNCNDCHVPQDNVFNKYYFKAKDGLRHATVFTMRNEPQVIFIKEEGKHAVQSNCVRCHNELITSEDVDVLTNDFHQHRSDRFCWDCHRHVPHGRVNSLSSVPHARVPLPESPVPEWLKNAMNNDK